MSSITMCSRHAVVALEISAVLRMVISASKVSKATVQPKSRPWTARERARWVLPTPGGPRKQILKISEKIMPEVTAWQNRPLEEVYPFVFLDAIHYKVKENHQYQTKAAYVVLGVTMDGTKDILGVWIGEHESGKFWLNVLNDLKSRGVLDVYLFCVDGLKGFVEAIGAVYPHSQVQRCIVHQIRSSTRFVSYKDIKPLMADLKRVYTAVTEDEALENLMVFKETWGKQYPSCVKSWEDNWDILSTFFAYPPEIRKII